jgi:hypothetical protein
MGDLEDAFLKQNVPGRYTSWSEENDDERRGADDADDDGNDNDDSEDDEYYLEGLPPLPGSTPSANDTRMEPSSASTSNGLQKSCNTGVKGVLADYREAQLREKEKARLKRQEGEVSKPKQSHHRHRHDNYKISKASIKNNDDSSNSDDDHISIPTDDEDSNGEYSKYLAQLPPGTVPHPFFRKSKYPKVTPEEYVQLVEEMENNVHKGVLCMIVHLFDSTIPECRHLHSVLKQMRCGSAKSSRSHFIEVDALEANPDMDTIILPTILIYDKRGELKHNLVRFTDDLPHGFTEHDLCEYFDKLGIIV